MKKTTKRIVIGVAAFVAVICGLSSLVVTKENEYTLIMRFGKINSIKTEAGLSFKVPFLDSEQTLPKEILLYDMAASDVITKDKKTMIADSYVLWQISDPILFSKTLNRSVSNAEGRIDAAVFNATKNAISTLTQNEVIAARDGELKELIMSKVGNSMDSYGVKILMAEIKQLDLPEDNKAAVYERMISAHSTTVPYSMMESSKRSMYLSKLSLPAFERMVAIWCFRSWHLICRDVMPSRLIW